MRREAEEVAPERLNVDGAMWDRLRSVDDHDRALLVRPGRELLDRVDRAERVRDRVGGDHLDLSRPGDLVERLERQLAVPVERDGAKLGARTESDLLPGDEVRVMLELGDDDHVARAEVLETPGVGDQVQRLGDVPGEDHLADGGRVQQRAHLLARSFEARRRPLREVVDGAVHVCVRVAVELPHRVQHLPRLLRGVRRVEIGERLAVHLALEGGKIGPQLAGIERGDGRLGHVLMVPAASRRPGGLRREDAFARRSSSELTGSDAAVPLRTLVDLVLSLCLGAGALEDLADELPTARLRTFGAAGPA